MILAQFSTRCYWLAAFLAMIWMVAACGAPSAPSGETVDAVMLEYRRSGGIAGWNDYLVIHRDGRCTLQRREGQAETFTLDQATLDALREAMAASQFFDLKPSYLPPRAVPDAFRYTITYQDSGRRHTVETSDGAVPPELAPVIDRLNRIIAER